MSALDQLIDRPKLVQVDEVELSADPQRVWELVRHGDLVQASWIDALFWVRELPGRLAGRPKAAPLRRIDALASSVEQPGFQLLVDEPPHELAVGAIGKVWKPKIPYMHVADGQAFQRFDQPGYVKVAWALRVTPDAGRTRLSLELRVDATDEATWRKFRIYFAGIGPVSHRMRRALLHQIERRLRAESRGGVPEAAFLRDARAQVSLERIIAAPPAQVWPWLVQMGRGRAGFYSIDWLDNGGVPSARELHPEWLELRPGERIPTDRAGQDGFEVLQIEEPHLLLLGGLYDVDRRKQLPFDAPRPRRYWQVAWAFELTPVGRHRTRLQVRARAAYPDSYRWHVRWVRAVHHLMQRVQLRRLAQRAEGRLPRNDYRDVLQGLGGMLRLAGALASPVARRRRQHWGVTAEVATKPYPGDALVPHPRWSWTHGIEVDAPPAAVWPWLAQIGADRAGFYSYQWLENLAGCRLRNAETIHPEWQAQLGDRLLLHPRGPALNITALRPPRYLVAAVPPDPWACAAGKRWAGATWTFLLQPIGSDRCRIISRYRAAYSGHLRNRLTMGPSLLEPIGYVMDRRMLHGLKQRSEGRASIWEPQSSAPPSRAGSRRTRRRPPRLRA